jgi:hypothetical protein
MYNNRLILNFLDLDALMEHMHREYLPLPPFLFPPSRDENNRIVILRRNARDAALSVPAFRCVPASRRERVEDLIFSLNYLHHHRITSVHLLS